MLYPHQQAMKDATYNSLQAGNNNILNVLCTGGGKSVIMSNIVADLNNLNQNIGIEAHRDQLVLQLSNHIAKHGIQHRIIGSNATISEIVASHRLNFNKSFINPTAKVAVIGVDTLMARKDNLKAWCNQVDYWLMDEAHHNIGNDRTPPNKWGKTVQMFSNARGIGFTATPRRADGQGLGRKYDGCFDDMIIGPSMRWLIENKYLCDFELVCPTSDLKVDDTLVSANGDWSNQTLRKAAKNSKIVGDVVKNYCKFAPGRKAIIFATDVETANEMAKNFVQVGIKAVALSGKSNYSYRNQTLNEFKTDKLNILINVDLFDEGFDVPACDVVIMARPTASLGKYLQMVGRALRYIPNKTALIIDHVSNVVRHKLPDKIHDWNLGRAEKRAKQIKDPEEIELTICKNPECAKPYEKFRTVCPYCNFEKPLPEPKSRSVEMVEGDLVLLDKSALDKMREATVLKSPGSIAKSVSFAAGPIAGKAAANRQLEKIEVHTDLSDSIAQWAAIEREKGFTDREIYKKFYLTTGYDVLSALDVSKTKKELQETLDVVKNWYL